MLFRRWSDLGCGANHNDSYVILLSGFLSVFADVAARAEFAILFVAPFRLIESMVVRS